RALAPSPLRGDGRDAGAGPAGRRAHPRSRRRASAGPLQDGRQSSRSRLLMDPDPSLLELSALVSRPDGRIDLARASLAIARWEYPRLAPHAHLDRRGAAPPPLPPGGVPAARRRRLSGTPGRSRPVGGRRPPLSRRPRAPAPPS